MTPRLRIRAASEQDPAAVPFIDLLFRRAGNAQRGRRLVSFLHSWEVFADELERTPTVEEYADRFHIPIATAYRDQALFRQVLQEETPDPLLRELWQAVSGPQIRHLLSVPVRVELDAPAGASPLLAWLVASVIADLPTGAGRQVARAAPDLSGTDGDEAIEMRRAYHLVDVAVFEWCRASLAKAGDEARVAGLDSCGRLASFDAEGAEVLAALLGEYRAEVGEPVAEICASAQRAARALVADGSPAELTAVDEFGEIGRAAAETLVSAFQAGGLSNVVAPVREVVEAALAHFPRVPN